MTAFIHPVGCRMEKWLELICKIIVLVQDQSTLLFQHCFIIGYGSLVYGKFV